MMMKIPHSARVNVQMLHLLNPRNVNDVTLLKELKCHEVTSKPYGEYINKQ